MSAPATLRVMSFNVRYDNPRDGDNRWSNRKEAAFEVAQAFEPDVLGLQEALPNQLADWRGALPEYASVAFGREGPEAGEAVALFARTPRVTVAARGGFWLSPTPDVPSQGWDASLPRVATWARLEVEGRPLTVVVTHLDHVGAESRRRSAEQLKSWLREHGEGPALVMGDFNAAPGGPAHAIFTGPEAPRLVDTYRAAHAEEPGPTYHDWGEPFVPARIDWILASEGLTVLEAGVDPSRPGGRWPSDHYPVFTVFEW